MWQKASCSKSNCNTATCSAILLNRFWTAQLELDRIGQNRQNFMEESLSPCCNQVFLPLWAKADNYHDLNAKLGSHNQWNDRTMSSTYVIMSDKDIINITVINRNMRQIQGATRGTVRHSTSVGMNEFLSLFMLYTRCNRLLTLCKYQTLIIYEYNVIWCWKPGWGKLFICSLDSTVELLIIILYFNTHLFYYIISFCLIRKFKHHQLSYV